MLTSLALVVALAAQPGNAAPLTVSAAISLTEALQDVAVAYRAAGGGPLSFNFAASNVLSRQIVNGAPADVFVSADEAQMDVVERAGLAAPGSRVDVAGNRLALLVGQSSAVHSVKDLALEEVRRIAMGDPAAVPAGVYARAYLERVGLWARLEPKIVPAGSVRAALTAVQNGSVNAAIVYLTDARLARDLRVAAEITGADAPRIVYPACVVRTSRQPAVAQHFLQFLASPVALRIFERHGFTRPARP